MHKISEPIKNSQHLTQAVLQICSMLGMYQAELARILGLQCSDIGELSSARQYLETDSDAERQACLLVRFFNLLFDRFHGDEVKVCNWFRRHSDELSGIPFYLIVDENKLGQVLDFLENV